MELKGIYIQEIFRASDSNYRIILVETETEKVIVSGSFSNIEIGLSYVFIGDYYIHAKYGKQFKATTYKKSTDTKTGLITYLLSDKFVGIGIKTATNIVDTLGLDALNLIVKDKTILDKVPNLSKTKKELLYEILKSKSEEDSVYIELYNMGLSPKMAKKIFENYGLMAVNIIKENPYRLIYEVDGYGFKKADDLALSLGFEKDNKIRIMEAILYCLDNLCYKNGNVFIEENDLIKEVISYLDIAKNLIDNCFITLVNNKRVVKINNNIYLNSLYNAEIKVANFLKCIKDVPIKKYKEEILDSNLILLEKELKFTYTSLQKKVIKAVLNDKIAIITGGPGTGKTTIVKGIIKLYLKVNKLKNSDGILLLAPTGRAAKRLQESCNVEAMTIHRGLGYDYNGVFAFNENNLLPYNLIIIDEASMIDIELAYRLLSAVNYKSQIIFIGDENQLPSVGPGEFLHDIIAADCFKVYRLFEVMRQVKDSNIIKLANMILEEKIEPNIFKGKKEVYNYNLFNNNLKYKIKQLLDNYLSKGNDLANIQILIPLYSGVNGIDEINKFVQIEYNKNKDKFLKYKDNIYYLNDRVLQLQNNPEKQIMNGDIGYIIEILDNSLTINFNNKIVELNKNDLDNLTLAYAISVHKSQGSEYDNVIFPLLSSYSIMLKRKLIYTAITRAKEKLIIIGDINFINKRIMLKEKLRNTSLMELLKEEKEVTPYDFL